MYIDEKRGIIAAGPINKGDNMTLPHRIVIRVEPNGYVVHMQIFNRDMSHGSFHHGDYVSSLSRALDFFVKRIKMQINYRTAPDLEPAA